MDSATALIDLLRNTPVLEDFLLRDMRNSWKEVGFALGTSGQAYAEKTGTANNVKLDINVGNDDEHLVHVHTHTSAASNEPSDNDIKRASNVDRVVGIIVLSQEMFDTVWNGHAVLFNEEGAVADRQQFRIVCDGSTDGPAEERYLSNPRVELR